MTSNYQIFLSTNGLNDFVRTLKQYGVADAEENKRLWYSYMSGNMEAREMLINKNIGLALKYVYKIRRKIKSYEFRDLVQEGLIGIMEAIDHYDPEKGSFSNIALHHIRKSINRALDNNDEIIRNPSHINNLRSKYFKYIKEHPNAQDEEIKEALEVTDYTFDLLKDASLRQEPDSLSKEIGDDGTTLDYFIGLGEKGYDNFINNMMDNTIMIWCKKELSPKYYYICYYRILSDEKKTGKVLGEELGITRSRVGQIENAIKKKLARAFTKEGVFNGRVTNWEADTLSVEPLSIENIIKFLYVKDEMSDLEKLVLKEYLLKTSRNPIPYLIAKTDLKKTEVEDIIERVTQKLQSSILADRDAYMFFRKKIKSTFGNDIFDCDERTNVEPFKKSLDYLFSIWKDKSYDEFQVYLQARNLEVPPELEAKVKKFFGIYPEKASNYLNLNLNMMIKNIKPNKSHLNRALVEFLPSVRHMFAPLQADYVAYRLGILSSNELKSKHKIQKISPMNIYLQKFYELYFHANRSYKTYNFNRNKYMSIREKCLELCSEDEIKILDMFYSIGNNRDALIRDMAQSMGINETEFKAKLRLAKLHAIKIYIGDDLGNDSFEIYRNYLLSSGLVFQEPTNEIVYAHFIDGQTNEELANRFKKTVQQISNSITTAKWKIDSYRFAISSDIRLPNNVLLKYVDTLQIDEVECEALRDYIEFGDGISVCQHYGIQSKRLYGLSEKLEKNTLRILGQGVNLRTKEIEQLIEAEHYEDILNQNEKQLLSWLYGITNEYNQTGQRLTIDICSKRLKLTFDHVSRHILPRALDKLRAKKTGLLRGPLEFMKREEIREIVNDRHIPLSDDDREMLSMIYGLNKRAMTLEEYAQTRGFTRNSVWIKLQRAFIRVHRYRNGEIKGRVVFEEDVEPYLKYFAKIDQEFLVSIYRDKKSVSEIAKRDGVRRDVVDELLFKLRVYLFDLQHGEIGFDFDYFWAHVNDEDVPLYGNKKMAIDIFKMYYEERMTIPRILEKHPEIDCTDSQLFNIIQKLKVAVMLKRSGVKKTREFTYEEIKSDYELYGDSMHKSLKLAYQSFLRNYDEKFVSYNNPIPMTVVYDMIKRREKMINVYEMNRDDLLILWKKYGDRLSMHDREILSEVAHIKGHQLMNNHDKMQVLKLIRRASFKRIIEPEKPFLLKPKE